MTSRERVIKSINHQEPDRVPLDIGGSTVTGISAAAYIKLKEHLELNTGTTRVFDVYQMLAEVEEPVRRRLNVDVVSLNLLELVFGLKNKDWKKWRFAGYDVEVPGQFNLVIDEHGDYILHEGGDLSKPIVARMPKDGLYFDSVVSTQFSDKFEKPDINEFKKGIKIFTDEELKFISKNADYLYKHTDYAILGQFWKGGLDLVGNFSDSMVLLISEPDYVNDLFSAEVEKSIENLKLYKQAVGDKIQAVVITGNDYGTQMGEFFNPSIFKELYVPHYKKINDWVHENTNWKTFFHSCGSIANIIEYFIEAGVDILNPVQCSAANMDPKTLKEKFGDKIVFWGGGVDTQSTLPRGTVEEVKKEVENRIKIFSPGGGFVFAAVHNIQYGTPSENIVAMCDTVVN